MTVLDEVVIPIGESGVGVRAKCQRRRVVGLDVWVEARSNAQDIVALTQLAVIQTHLRFIGTLDGGGGRVRLRFMARDEEVHLTDGALVELVNKLADRLMWTGLTKLEEYDCVPAFAPFPLS
ncbi:MULTISPECIES: hypothetical protein [Ferrimicrobium]|uniref:hypothetical protein n=1 Tax=Ferrimicrobium TaxID=121038 RepID=UPI0023F2E3F3|nr:MULTISPECIES: hypothetical protein [Ferrimicrobium]